MQMRKYFAGTLLLLLTSCSHPASAIPAPPPPGSEDELEYQSHRLDVFASIRQDANAFQFYSPRCQLEIGGLEQYSKVLDQFFAGRHPDYTRTIAHASGTYGEVMSIDRDPGAPAWVMMPRKWRFIDGRWQFDNC